jgi:cation diffusion facilitator CzcD-associated flavoprotein CzcO
MSTSIKDPKSTQPARTLAKGAARHTEHFDVIIIGAGISGIGGGYHLTKQCPGASFVILDTKESFGGTWVTHQYPGLVVSQISKLCSMGAGSWDRLTPPESRTAAPDATCLSSAADLCGSYA